MPLRVDHFNSFLTGGAATAVVRMIGALKEMSSLQLRLFCMQGAQVPPEAASIVHVRNPHHATDGFEKLKKSIQARLHYARIGRSLRRVPSEWDPFTPAHHFYRTPLRWFGEISDVIHLHWIADWIDYPSFFATIPDDLPVVWTLHDQNPFTGGCHYAAECTKYSLACGACPQLNSKHLHDLSARTFQIKRKALLYKNLHVVANSIWQEEQAKRSDIFSSARSFRTIHLGVDTGEFRPLDRQESRGIFQIDLDAYVVAFGATSISNRRKGLKELQESLRLLGNWGVEVHCLVFGPASNDRIKKELPNMSFVGSVNNAQLLARVYSAADVFVIPSLQEAFGQTALEAMACGVPVVGFDTGGIPDMVEDYSTGRLAPVGDINALAERLQWMAEHPDERKAMGVRARQVASEKFSLKKQAEAYYTLYEHLVEEKTQVL